MSSAPAKSYRIAPLEKFLHEVIGFWAARSYLLGVHLVAMKKRAGVAKEQANLQKWLPRTYKDSHSYFTSRLYISLIASFELFLRELIAQVVMKHPKKVGTIEFPLSDVIDSHKDELVQRALEIWLNKVMYKKPLEYFADIATILSIEYKHLEDDWKIFIEAKARRDLGVHNEWKCNATYLRKLRECDITPTFNIGDITLENDDKYLRHVSNALSKIATDMSEQVLVRHSALPPGMTPEQVLMYVRVVPTKSLNKPARKRSKRPGRPAAPPAKSD